MQIGQASCSQIPLRPYFSVHLSGRPLARRCIDPAWPTRRRAPQTHMRTLAGQRPLVKAASRASASSSHSTNIAPVASLSASASPLPTRRLACPCSQTLCPSTDGDQRSSSEPSLRAIALRRPMAHRLQQHSARRSDRRFGGSRPLRTHSTEVIAPPPCTVHGHLRRPFAMDERDTPVWRPNTTLS
jgi:hypothetical protein